MSDPVSAMSSAASTDGLVTITDIGPVGMITLRGDLAAKPLQKAAIAAGGVNMPEQGRCLTELDRGIAWMSPDELLILCRYDEVTLKLTDLQGKLAKQHALAVNVSDARAVFELRGAHVREVMAKLAPVDMHPGSFTPGMFRRTRLAQSAAAFWMPEEGVVHVICFRSVAQYVFDLLRVAAQPGSEVAFF